MTAATIANDFPAPELCEVYPHEALEFEGVEVTETARNRHSYLVRSAADADELILRLRWQCFDVTGRYQVSANLFRFTLVSYGGSVAGVHRDFTTSNGARAEVVCIVTSPEDIEQLTGRVGAVGLKEPSNTNTFGERFGAANVTLLATHPDHIGAKRFGSPALATASVRTGSLRLEFAAAVAVRVAVRQLVEDNPDADAIVSLNHSVSFVTRAGETFAVATVTGVPVNY